MEQMEQMVQMVQMVHKELRILMEEEQKEAKKKVQGGL